MTTEPVLILMCGLPFAGKTTVARKIASHLGWRYISLDAINTKRGVGLDGNAIAQDEWTQTYAEAHRRIKEVLGAGCSVIFDDTNFLRSQRDHLRSITSSCHAETYILYVPTPEVEVRERWRRNHIKRQRGNVRDDDFELVIRQFEPPTPRERVILFDLTVPMDTWFSQFRLPDIYGLTPP